MTAYENRIGALSPVLWTKLDGSGAPTSSGSSTPTFTLSGTAPTTGVTSGISNTCYTFNGNGQYSIGALPSNTTTDKNFTMETWVKMNPSTSMDYPTIYRADNGANGVLIMRVRGANVASPGLVEMYMKGNSTAISFYSTSRVDDNNWHHIAFRHDGFSYFLYIDGVQEHFGSTGTGAMNDIDSSGTRYFGGGTAANEYFVGSIDEFAIYGSTLNPGQIYGNYALGKYPTSMQAKISSYNPEWYWEMDAVDSSAPTMNNYGSTTDTASWTRTTVSGSSITRVASTLPTSTANPYMLSIPYASRYRSSSTAIWSTEITDKDFVFGVWWKMNTGTAGSTALTFIGGNAGSGCGMYMYSQTATSNAGCVFWNAAGSASGGSRRVDDGNWHFIAIRKSSANNDYKCYIDGVLDVTITSATTPSISNWQIGDSTQGSQSATGYIDSMFIASATNVLEADLLGIYQLAFPASTNITINETPATASAQFQDASAVGSSTVSWSTIPATVNAEFVTPALSFSQDVDRLVSVFTADSTFVDPTISAIQNVDFASGALTANADFSPTTGISIDDAYTAAPSTA